MTVGSDVFVDAGTVAAMLTADPPPTGVQADFLVDVLSAAPDDALEFVTGQVECRAARGADTEPLVAMLRVRARSRDARAVAALVAARAAEGAGHPDTARDLLGDALALNPGLAPALHDAAGYAAARGEYLTAAGLLERSGTPHPLQPGLREALAAVAGDDVPRNSPCPCGSGRKFKVCCRRGAIPPLSARAQLLYALLGSYAERAPGLEIARPLAELTADPQQHLMFCLDLALFRTGVVERFLAARGTWLRPDERALIERWRAVPLAVYEVVDVERGTGVTLRALPDGAPIHLADRSFSTCVQRLGLFCGRVLHDGTEPHLFALPIPVPRHRRRELLVLLASDPSAEQVAGFFGPEGSIRIRNLDDDDASACRATYQAPGAQQAFDRLATRLTRTGADLLARHRVLPDGRVLCLGEISWAGRELTVTANSPRRLAELEDVLRSAVPDAVLRDRRIEPASPATGEDDLPRRSMIVETYYTEVEPGLTGREVRERMAIAAEASWVDHSRVVCGRTPREAAASADPVVRAELRSMIDDVEAVWLDAQRSGRPADDLMDPDRLRRALGLVERASTT